MIARRRVVLAGVLLTFGTLVCQVAVARATVYSYDGNIMFAVARNLVARGTLVTTGQDPFSHDPWNLNTPHSIYGLGTSLLVAPAAALELALGMKPFMLVTYVNPVIVAATAAVVQRIGAGLGWDLRLATLAGAVLALATPLLWGGTELMSEPAITLCTAVVVLAAIRWRDGRSWAPLAFGAAVGASIQFRTDSVLLLGVAFVALPLLVPPRQLLADRRGLLLAGLPIAGSLVLVGWYNAYRFGTVMQQPYGNVGFDTPLLEGLGGLLLSPGKGMLVYSPVVLLGLAGMVPLFRRDRGVFALIALLAVARTLFFAKWGVWHGGLGWGPRFLMPLGVLLIVPAAEAVRADRHWQRIRPWRYLAVTLVALGVGISALSVSVPYEQWWTIAYSEAVAAGPDGLGQWERDFPWALSQNHVVGNLRLLANGDAVPAPYWWQDERSWIGPIMLTTGGLALLGALCAPYAGRLRPRGQRAGEPQPSDGEGCRLPVDDAGEGHQRESSLQHRRGADQRCPP